VADIRKKTLHATYYASYEIIILLLITVFYVGGKLTEFIYYV